MRQWAGVGASGLLRAFDRGVALSPRVAAEASVDWEEIAGRRNSSRAAMDEPALPICRRTTTRIQDLAGTRG